MVHDKQADSKRGVFYGFQQDQGNGSGICRKKARTLHWTWPKKGKTQALIVNEQGKLLKAQRQLGALVYSLAKGKEENQPLVDKYIEMIDNIEQEIARLKASLTPAEAAEAEYVVHEEVPADQPEEHKACPQCGAPVSDDALFCNKCGAQL